MAQYELFSPIEYEGAAVSPPTVVSMDPQLTVPFVMKDGVEYRFICNWGLKAYLRSGCTWSGDYPAPDYSENAEDLTSLNDDNDYWYWEEEITATRNGSSLTYSYDTGKPTLDKSGTAFLGVAFDGDGNTVEHSESIISARLITSRKPVPVLNGSNQLIIKAPVDITEYTLPYTGPSNYAIDDINYGVNIDYNIAKFDDSEVICSVSVFGPGEGELIVEKSEIYGSGIFTMLGSGETVNHVSEVSGLGNIRHIGSGEINNNIAEIYGSGSFVIFGSGELILEKNEVYGSGNVYHVGSGEIDNDIAEIYGIGNVCHVGYGELVGRLPMCRGSTTDNRIVSYSVGNSYGTDLKVGDNVSIEVINGIAIFNTAQTGNIGRGDKIITAHNGIIYLNIRYNYYTWGVLDITGLPSTDFSDTVSSIERCFPTINAAVGSTGGIPHATGIANASFVGTGNLVAAGVCVNIVCYNDDGTPDTESAVISGFITGTRNYIFITAAGTNIGMFASEGRMPGADSDNYYSNYPQHTTTGIAGEGYVLEVDSGDAAIDVYDCMVGINNLDIAGTVDIGIRIYGLSDFYDLGRGANNCRVKNCIIRNSGSYGIYVYGVSKYLNNLSVWDNLFYGQSVANVRMLNGINRAYVYNSILDKGSSTCTALMLGDGGSDFIRIDIAYNLFVGGDVDKDISISGPISLNVLVDNRGQDPNYFATARTSNWFGNDRIASYDDMFVDRTNYNYNIKSTASQQYLAGYCSASYSLAASHEVWPYDLKADLRAAKPRISLGCLESLFSFEFSGSDVLFIDQQKLVYYTNSDTGYFKSLSDASAYMGATFILSMDLESALEYQKEEKVLIGVKKTRSYDRRYRIIKEYRAIADVYRNTIFIDKEQSFDAAFFSRAIGSRNYIFKYDMEQRKLSVGIFEELEKGMSGKNNVLNQVKLRR